MNRLRNKFSILYPFIRSKSTLPKTSKIQLKCGQPTVHSHPHLLKQGEIVPYIQISEFQNRREKLLSSILNENKVNNNNNIIVIPSATKKYMSDKIPYVFRQNTDYLYLSGCLEPDSCLIITTKTTSNDLESTLFVRNPDNNSEQWDGPRTNAESAPSLFGVDKALPMSDLSMFLQSYLLSKNNCFLWYDAADAIQPYVDKIMQNLVQSSPNVSFKSPKMFIHQLRLLKSPAEIELMKKSCEIASRAFHKTMATSKPNISEHQLFATVDYECRMNGAEYLAYPPVVAGGERATIIHYINNNQIVADGQLVLMDAGCEFHGYSSDITRTWPINGTFSPEQKMLYEVIREVQSDLLKILSFYTTLDSLFDAMCAKLGKKLQEIGFVSNNVSPNDLYKAAYKFCPHHVSHYLGMDVHDTSLISRNIPLQPGMIITMEPGIYISERHQVPPQFHGIGIRIEDDVLITENGPVILSENCIKDPEAIQNIINSHR